MLIGGAPLWPLCARIITDGTANKKMEKCRNLTIDLQIVQAGFAK
jgi:hypothetical protein